MTEGSQGTGVNAIEQISVSAMAKQYENVLVPISVPMLTQSLNMLLCKKDLGAGDIISLLADSCSLMEMKKGSNVLVALF